MIGISTLASQHHLTASPPASTRWFGRRRAAGDGAAAYGSARSSSERGLAVVWSVARGPYPVLLDEGQHDQDGRQDQTEAYGSGLGNLVRLEFRPLGRGLLVLALDHLSVPPLPEAPSSVERPSG